MPIAERLWAPHRLFVTDDGELKLGRGVGQFFDLPELPPGTIGQRQRLLDARHTLWVVERSRLDEKLIEDYALVLPERLIDRDLQPHAHHWLAQLSLISISGVKSDRLVGEGRLRVYRVAVEERAGGLEFAVEAAGGGTEPWTFSASVAELEATEHASDVSDPRGHLKPAVSVVDRVLRQLSAGVLDEDSVIAALQAVTLIEPGCGYRGALDGVPATIEEVQFGARALEAVFSQVDPRAETQQASVAAIAAALSMPRADEEPLPCVPLYGDVERLWVEPLALELGPLHGKCSVGGTEKTALVLSRELRFFVANSDRWQPTIPAELRRELRQVLRARQPVPLWLAFLAVPLLVAIIVVSLVLRH